MTDQDGTRPGWLSLALGAAELAAPRGFSRIGAREHSRLLRLRGAGEIVTRLAILSRPRAAGWVGGDDRGGAARTPASMPSGWKPTRRG